MSRSAKAIFPDRLYVTCEFEPDNDEIPVNQPFSARISLGIKKGPDHDEGADLSLATTATPDGWIELSQAGEVLEVHNFDCSDLNWTRPPRRRRGTGARFKYQAELGRLEGAVSRTRTASYRHRAEVLTHVLRFGQDTKRPLHHTFWIVGPTN